MTEIAVIGGGIVGMSSALRLAEEGRTVTLFDDRSAGKAASWGNAGHIAIEQVAPLASCASLKSIPKRLFSAGGALDLPAASAKTWLPFGLRMIAASRPSRFRVGSEALGRLLNHAMPAWEHLEATLGSAGMLKPHGHYVLWESNASAERGRANWANADIGTARFTDIGDRDFAAIHPLVHAPIANGIRFSGTGHIADLDLLRDALRNTLAAQGVRIVEEKVMLRNIGGGARVEGYDADTVLITAGARSGDLVRSFGHKAPIIAERGYHIRASAEHWPAEMPPLVFEDRSMIVTRFGDTVQAASFVEFNRFDAPADPRKWERLERHIGELGLPMHGPFERWMGARPTLPDYLPAIGRSRRAGNLFYAFGHQHLGLTLAPITAELIAALVAGRSPATDLAAFDLDRF